DISKNQRKKALIHSTWFKKWIFHPERKAQNKAEKYVSPTGLRVHSRRKYRLQPFCQCIG
ncbi:MAG: hypothetical protein JW857_00865, partial [Bacteroidales bacterium]|nr:hypothetical protein [Bacteroidales bacterium]